MRKSRESSAMKTATSVLREALSLALFLSLSFCGGWVRAAEAARTFTSPEEAVASLISTVGTNDPVALTALFGPEVIDLENPDRVQATNEMSAFACALVEQHRIVRQSESNCVVEVGTNRWPFPIPLAKRDGRWFFDTAAGKEEMLNRRIGRNELAVLEVVRAYVEAQREYASRDRDGDGVLEYAQRLSSTPGTQDGLYWPPEVWDETSPLGPLVAAAQGGGYHLDAAGVKERPQAFHGYYFKILAGQGKHAPGGQYDYVINGNMIGGFALVAWPAGYGDSGIMTFIVNQQGIVYEKDLGSKTDKLVRRMKAYDPDSSWIRSPD